MHEPDDTRSRFESRFQAIESQVPDRPFEALRLRARPRRRPGLSLLAAAAAILLVLALIVVPPALRRSESSGVGGPSSTPTATDRPTSTPTVSMGPSPTPQAPASPSPVIVAVGEAQAACLDIDVAVCADIAGAGLTSLGRVGPPTGIITARTRRTCPPVADGVDASRCWQVETPTSKRVACVIVARRTANDTYVRVAGDFPAGMATRPWPRRPSGCPNEAAYMPLDPSPPPEAAEGPCGTTVQVVDRLVSSIETAVGASPTVVIARITGIGDARWNTPDGRAPARSAVTSTGVIRLVQIDVGSVLKGMTPVDLTVWVPGGEIGCHRFTPGLIPDLAVGGQYVMLLDGGAAAASPDGVGGVSEMWEVEDNRVATPFEVLPLSEFMERVARVVE
jgi:hypothetical protein